jgi:hypothetical protein
LLIKRVWVRRGRWKPSHHPDQPMNGEGVSLWRGRLNGGRRKALRVKNPPPDGP